MVFGQKIRDKITNQKQMSDSLLLNLLLAFSGGFQDAYTYIVRDKVFANAQTGNIVLMSTHFMVGNYGKGLRYLFPIFSFMLGVFIADTIQFKFKNAKILHWRQGIVLSESAIMIIVGFLSQEHNMLANCMISFSCAMQLFSFKKVHSNPYASTMCIGNLKSGVSALSTYLRTRNAIDLNKALDYFVVILVFAFGAGFGGNLSQLFSEKTIWISACLLLVGTIMMDLDRNRSHKS